MKDQFVSYEQALALKELGFDEPCFTTYDNEGRLRNPFDYPKSEHAYNLPYIEDTKEWIYNSDLNNPANFHAANNPTLLKFYLDNPFTAAPLYQQVFDWFRKQHNLFGAVDYTLDGFYGIIDYVGKLQSQKTETKNTYEEARLACLVKLIEIVKSKK